MPSEAVAVTLRVTQTLDDLQIPYVIGGSMASTAYGRVRATMDVDIVADLQAAHVEPLVERLGKEFYTDAQMMYDAIANQSSFNLIHLATMFKVDFFVASDRPFAQQQLARRQPQLLEPPDHMAYISSPEDVILAKLDWYKLGGEVSERQWRDIQGVLEIQGQQLDRPYLQQWASTLSVTNLLNQAFSEYEARQQPE